MLEQPSMIKRPVLDLGGGKLLVGFAPEQYQKATGLTAAHQSALRRGHHVLRFKPHMKARSSGCR